MSETPAIDVVIFLTKEKLYQALLQWEQGHREGKTLSHDEAAQLSDYEYA